MRAWSSCLEQCPYPGTLLPSGRQTDATTNSSGWARWFATAEIPKNAQGRTHAASAFVVDPMDYPCDATGSHSVNITGLRWFCPVLELIKLLTRRGYVSIRCSSNTDGRGHLWVDSLLWLSIFLVSSWRLQRALMARMRTRRDASLESVLGATSRRCDGASYIYPHQPNRRDSWW